MGQPRVRRQLVGRLIITIRRCCLQRVATHHHRTGSCAAYRSTRRCGLCLARAGAAGRFVLPLHLPPATLNVRVMLIRTPPRRQLSIVSRGGSGRGRVCGRMWVGRNCGA